jgi:hypothetical protein
VAAGAAVIQSQRIACSTSCAWRVPSDDGGETIHQIVGHHQVAQPEQKEHLVETTSKDVSRL